MTTRSKFRLALAASVAFLAAPVLAHADDSDKAAQLQMQIDALQKQINEMKTTTSSPMASMSTDGPLTWKGITIFGTVDVGATWQNHGAPLSDTFAPGLNQYASAQNQRSLFSGGENNMSQSKFGVKGEEDVGGGFKGLFLVETYFNPLSGQISNGPQALMAQKALTTGQLPAGADSGKAGQTFGQAYAGIKHDTFGTLTFGRSTTSLLDTIMQYDPIAGAQAFSPLGYSGTYGGGAGDTSMARMDSLLKYDNKIGIFHIGGMYQLEGNAGTGNLGSFEVISGVTYGGLSVDGLFGKIKDAMSLAAASSTSLKATASDNTVYAGFAKYGFGATTLMGGYQHITYSDPSGYVPNNATFEGYLLTSVNNMAYSDQKQLQVYWIGSKYQITPAMTIAGALYRITENTYNNGGIVVCAGNAASGAGIVGTNASNCKGQFNFGSLALDYKWTPRIDSYAGFMYSHAAGGFANGFATNTNAGSANEINPTVGVRYSF